MVCLDNSNHNRNKQPLVNNNMGYVYSNPYADAANAFSGGANTLGDTVLKMAMLRQNGMQRQQELMMQMAQMQQSGQFNQQRLGMEQQGLDLQRTGQQDTTSYRNKELAQRLQEITQREQFQNKEFGLKEKEFGQREKEGTARIAKEQADTDETKQRGAAEKQRLEDAQKFQGARDVIARMMPKVGKYNPTPQGWHAPMQMQPGMGPQSQEPDLQQLLGAIAQTSKTPQEGMQTSMLIQALQNGALNPQTEQSILTGFAPQRPQMDPQLAIILKGLSGVLQKNAAGPEDYMSGMNKVLGANPLGGGGQGSSQPIFAVNPQTKQRIQSFDGGVTWQPAQ